LAVRHLEREAAERRDVPERRAVEVEEVVGDDGRHQALNLRAAGPRSALLATRRAETSATTQTEATTTAAGIQATVGTIDGSGAGAVPVTATNAPISRTARTPPANPAPIPSADRTTSRSWTLRASRLGG